MGNCQQAEEKGNCGEKQKQSADNDLQNIKRQLTDEQRHREAAERRQYERDYAVGPTAPPAHNATAGAAPPGYTPYAAGPPTVKQAGLAFTQHIKQKRDDRDYTIIVDQSGSMLARDAQGVSRWDQARDAVSYLADEICALDPDGEARGWSL